MNENNKYEGNAPEIVEPNANQQVKITLQSGADNRIVVLARKSTRIYKLLNTFCKERNVSPKEYRLIFKNKVLREDATVDCYNLSDGDVIDVAASQTGGNC